MFFKKLEIFGFKSFAEKTRIDFEAGVTAIVGPNGCGKTNLLDSIKWVLGEQSVRSMRGTKMEDVIFHGADNIAGVGLAEASLTISNQQKLLPLDFEELTITRRIFRSGESEYLINKVPVRLKDIAELLMDTGLGMRSYSLMEQGKVDMILSSRPEDRRDIFEEASGITKYKSRREETLRKLERTQENLARLGDIIVEVKRQLKSMERQVNKARRYKEEFARLKEYELKVNQVQYHDLRKEKQDLENKIKELEKEEVSFSARINSTSHSLQKTRQDLSRVEQEFSSAQAESYECCAAIETADSKAALNEERIEELTRRQDELLGEIQSLCGKIARSSEQTEKAQGRIKVIEQQKKDRASFLTAREEDINNILTSVKEAQKKISQDKQQEVEIIARQTRVKNDLTKLAANLANFNARLRRLNVESERTGQDIGNIEDKQKGVSGELDALNEQLRQLRKGIWDLKSNLDIKLRRKQKMQLCLGDVSQRLASLQSRLSFLKEITRRHEGFSKGVQAILAARDSQELKVEGLCGVLADLLEVPAEYQTSIELALGENAQALVVENAQAAVDCINHLKEKNSGRAGFICLENLKQDIAEVVTPKQTLGEAKAFVRVGPKYQKVLEGLLANTFIVQDIETARGVLQQTGPAVRLVTLNGEVLTGTSISGGSVRGEQDCSLLGRQERIRQNAAELDKLREEKAGLENQKIMQEEEIEELSRLIQEKESSLDKLKIQFAGKESEKANIEAERKRFQDETAVLKVELEETNEQLEQLQAEQQGLEQELSLFQERQKQHQQRIQEQEAFITEKNQERQNALVEITEAKTHLSALDRETEDAKARLQMILETESEQKAACAAKKEETQDTTTKIEQLKHQIDELKEKSKDLSQAKIDTEERVKRTKELRRRLTVSIRDLEDGAAALQSQLDKLREKKANLQVKFTELNYKRDALKDKMYRSYQVDLEASLENIIEISPPEPFVFTEIERLKERLEGLGPVNLVAIEENDQLQQRHSFLISQQEDLISAQESLRKAISQINRTARRMFLDTFQKIQVSFKEYFRILFGGGDARLILLDENNILESGIEIVLRPPGKKLQNISLLSGGEKALTAIALLFAIFKVKPSPFCILDEVDAALDEANIDRFTNLLSEFIKTSQFIIITHNKKTINMANIMYGITMEKSGVSKIVSVRLTEERDKEREFPAREMAPIG